MHKTTFLKVILLTFIFLQGFISYSQNFKTFTTRYSKEIKGDMLLIGNNILGKDNNPLNDNSVNENISMQYINVDPDIDIFCSSSSTLVIPPATTCFRVVYAGLYWGAILNSGSRTDIKKVKFKLPGSAVYTDITGQLIYDADIAPIDPDSNKPYACYADVTSLVAGLTNPQGIYTVANVVSSLGFNGTTGLSAGWTLFVVYEDPTATTKYINSFDGFVSLFDQKTLSIPVSGFKTPSSGIVNLQYGFATLGGDKTDIANKAEIINKAIPATIQRPSNEFFNSSITDSNGYLAGRVPNSNNTLGYDTGLMAYKNAAPSAIGYGVNSATINLQIAKGQADPIFDFFNVFSTDVIAPDISLTKIVEDASGKDIGNTTINLGQDLYYKIDFQNIGNDNITNFTLVDVLPKNVVFNYPADITSLPAGVTHTYNATTRRLLFTIPNSLVKIGDPINTIRLHVKVVSDYNLLSDACSNEIKNQAFASYSGVVSKTDIKSEGSFASTVCNFGTPSSTNFLANTVGHTFTRTVQLCNSAVLSASNGYDSYSWSTSPTGTPVVGTSQNYTVTETGTYYVNAISNANCKSIKEEITVIPTGNITNPVIPYADEVVICPNNGKELPYIFLCGANATKSIQTNIAGATIVWEKLNESSCDPSVLISCANENPTCLWTSVGEGANYLVNTSGQFRVTINSGGCFSRFYFNVYQNLLSPTETHNDIICNTPGKITIGGVPEGYEYSLNATGPFQSSNVFPNAIFPVLAAGSYTVYIKQVGVATNPCVFSVPNILIRQRNFTTSEIVTQPLCNGDKGAIRLAAGDARPQYFYSISKGGTLVSSSGLIAASDFTFSNLDVGTYTYEVKTDDGCLDSGTIEIKEPVLLKATVALTKALTCANGEITVYPLGGTPPYTYYVNGSSVSQSVPQIVVTNPLPLNGIYSIKVVDVNNCEATTAITVAATPPPTWTVSSTNIKCYGYNTGEIKFDVTVANGYTIMYSIDNGANYSLSDTFSNLPIGIYSPKIKYSLAGTDCFDTKPNITLTQASTALTASAGVSELAGCGPNGEGKVRITNPQGGTPFAAPNFYKYSFDGGITWVNANEAYLMPGTYTVYIKDANDCVYPMTVILDAQPPVPTIEVVNSAFNCDGSASSTVTVTNGGGSNYAYEYLLDGIPNPNTANPKVFLNVPSGTHEITVNYKLLSVPTYSNLLYEDFGNGDENVKSPGASTNFCFENQLGTGSCGTTPALHYGEYTVTNTLHPSSWHEWNPFPKDHSGDKNGKGRFFVTDVGTVIKANDVCYKKTIHDIIPNRDIEVEIWVRNLFAKGMSASPDPILILDLEPVGGTLATALSKQETGPVPRTNGWVPYKLTLNPGDNTSLDFAVRIKNPGNQGIDFAFDDIRVYQLPVSCITQKNYPLVVPTDKAFEATVSGTDLTCATSDDGTITIVAQNFDITNGFEYSVNGGINWANSTTSPVKIENLAAASYNIQVRYNNSGDCTLPLGTIEVKAPTPVTVSASVTLEPTCTTGATITALGDGGTGVYQYELREADGIAVVRAFQVSEDFLNVPAGNYTVFAKDANSCVSAVGAPVPVIAPTPPTATLDATSNLCFDSNATIVVTIAGGVGPFSYKVKVDAGTYSAPTPTFTGTSFTYTATATGSYSFIVIDKNNCESLEVVQTISPKLAATPSIKTALSCYPTTPEATIEVKIVGGTSPYNYIVKNSLGDILVANGTTTVPIFQYLAATADIYTFEIKDANNCPITITQKVDALVAVIAKATVTDVTCFGVDNGSVILEALTGVAPYTFQIIGHTVTSVTNTIANYSNLAGSVAGITYNYIVTDSKNCVYNGTFIVKQPEVIVAIAEITTPYTCDNPATIKVTSISGGNGSYKYTLNRNATAVTTNTTGVFPNLTVPGIYTVSISDAKGCPLLVDAGTIVALDPPTAMTFSPTTLTCPSNKVDVTIGVSGGTGTLFFAITAPASAITNTTGAADGVFTGLAPGVYTFEVKDANNCTYSKPYSIAPLPVFTVSGVVDADVQCLGEANGSATFTVSGLGNNVNYTYSVDMGAVQSRTSPNAGTTFEIPVTGLTAGDHTILVTNTATNCSETATINIAAPIAALVLNDPTLSHVTCIAKGKAVINAVGGWGTYTYMLTPVLPIGTVITQANNIFVNLAAGDYSFTVTDLKGCEVSGAFSIDDKVAVVASIDPSSILCYDPTNKATIKVTPDTFTNYVYSINNATPQNNGTFAGLTPGKYTIRVTDTATGCYIDLAEQTIALPITASITLLKDLDCDPTNPEAKIQVSIKDGYPDYSYKVSTTAGSFTGTPEPVGIGLNTFIYTTDTAGTYYFEITDSKGCTTVVSRTIAPLINPDFSTTQVDVKCKGDNTGSITVTGIPTTGTYTYSKDNGLTFQSSNVFTGLVAGSYQIVVKDAKQCLSAAKSIEIKEPDDALDASALVTTTLTCGSGNVSQAAIITVTAADGTPFAGGKYKYDYGNGFVDSNTFATNTPGTVNIIVKDANGCTTTVSVLVDALDAPTAIAFDSPDPITCETDHDKTNLTIRVVKGIAPFKFEITSTDAAVAPVTPIATGVTDQFHTFEDLAPGNYFFKVTDANGCTVVGDYKIDAVVAIQAVGAIVTNVTCNGAADGKIKFTVSGNRTGGYTYSLTGSISGIITGLDAKTGDVISYSGLKGDEDYTFTVTNTATKCVATKTITLSQPAAITALDANATKVFCSKTTSTITVSASGGTSPLYFAVVKLGAAAPVFPEDYNTTGLFTKDTSVDGLAYVAYVIDKNGNCSQNIPVNVVNNVAPTIDPVADTCYPGASFAVTVSGTVYPSSSIQYGIGTTATNINYNTNSVKNITAPGTYFIGVKDDNGCEVTTSFIVNEQLTLTPKLDKDITCSLPVAAQITLSAGGGAGTYTYEYRLDPSATYSAIAGNVYNPTVAGDYYFRVTSGGCSVETIVPVKVTDPVLPTANHNAINLSCYQSADGVVTLIPLTGATPFTYSFNGSPFTSNPTYSNLSASSVTGYPYIVRDAKGCEVTGNAVVTEPAQITFTYTTVNMLCPGPSLGSVTISAITNGVAPFTYELRNTVTGVTTVLNQPGDVTYTFSNLSYGDFVLTVSDASGCSNFKDDVKIIAPPSDLNINLLTPIANCLDGATIIVDLNPVVYPANPNYKFGIYDLSALPFSSNLLPSDIGSPLQHTFTGLTPGVVYTFVVYDPITDCYYFQKAAGAIPPLTTLKSDLTALPVRCKGSKTGGVSFEISDYDATQVDYEIFSDQTNISTGITGSITSATILPVVIPDPAIIPLPTGLYPGTYYIKFTEVGGTHSGCTSSSTTFVVIESAVNLTVTAVSLNDNCKTDAGQVIATPNGGTGPFKYIINKSSTAPLVTDTWGANNVNIFNVESGSYHVWVKDANNCIQGTTVTVLLDPDPVFDLSIVDYCAGEGNFSVNINITEPTLPLPPMADYSVSVNGGGFVAVTGLTYTATGLNSGEQTIVIKNKNGCPTTQTIDINARPVASAAVTKVLDCSVDPILVENAVITVTISKGTPPYTYEVKKGAGLFATFAPTETVVSGVTTVEYPVNNGNSGIYTFRITDANDCPIETNEVVISPIVPIVPDYTPIEPLCNGGTGTIEITATGGQGSYTYTLIRTSPPLGILQTQTTAVFTDLIAGDYTYTITDELGCTETAYATLGEPTEVTVGTPVITPLTCGPGNVGQAATVNLSLVASGGSGTYLYSFAGSGFSTQTSYTVEDIDADQLNIPFAVQDENGCEASGTLDILKLNPPTDFDLTQGPVITCSTLSTTVTISNVQNAVGSVTLDLTYQIISPIGAIVDNMNVPTFTNLAPGNYVFQVTDEATGCVKQLPFEIKDVVKINIVEQSTTGITCFGATDGKASFFVSGFAATATYHYKVDGVLVPGNFSSPTIDLTGLAAGSHTIEVFDDVTDCPKLISFETEAPTAALDIDKTVTPLGCTTFGAVTITATDGWGNYEYTLTQPDLTVLNNNTGVFGGLTQNGPYNISVKDGNGCEKTDSFTLTIPINPIATIDVASDYCYDGTNATTLVVKASLGVAPYFFSIDNGVTFNLSNSFPVADDTYTFSNLSPGSYNVVVKDAYGCKSIVPLNTVIESQLFASAENKKDIFCTVGDENGTIRISAVGGYGSYEYTVSDGVTTSLPIAFPVGSSTADFAVTVPGTYTFVVYDAKGCSYAITNTVVMVAPTAVTFSAVPTSPSCSGTQGTVDNGSILVTLDATNNNPDYTYRLTSTAGLDVTQTNNGLFTGLSVGTYEVTVTSARGCSDIQTNIVITAPAAVVALASPSPFTCSATNTLNATIVTVTGTGGAGTGAIADYKYSKDGINWNDANTFPVFDTEVVQNLTYYVKDANGCVDDVQIPINPFPKLISAIATQDTKIDCLNNTETIKVDISGGTNTPNAFTYQAYKDGVADGGLVTVTGTTFNYPATTAGSYYEFEIFDNNTGCSIKSTLYEVPVYDTMQVIASPAANVDCFGNATGAIEINIVDYSGPYSYEILKGGVATSFNGLGNTTTNPFVLPHGLIAGTDYTIVVTQTAYPSCPATSDDVEITQPTALDLSGLDVKVKNQYCDSQGAVLTVDVSTILGGTRAYEYAFVPKGGDPTAFYSPSPTKTIATTQIAPAFDEIDVYVKDANGCFAFRTVQISADPMPAITNVTVDNQCADANGYRIDVTATGVLPLRYSLDGEQFQDEAFFTVFSSGDYTVTVMDANQCKTTATTAVTVLEPLTLRGEVSLVPTCKDADGEITLYVTGGTVIPANNYVYFDKNIGTLQPSNVFTGYAPGTYDFVVRDLGTLCEKEVQVIIDNPTLVTGITATPTAVTCKGGSDGSILVSLEASNNNPIYTYALSGPAGFTARLAQESPLFENLPAGDYTITVTSGRGCSATAPATVGEPAIILVNAPVVTQFLCNTGTNGANYATITVDNVTGGSSTYKIYEFFKVGNPIAVQRGTSNSYTELDYAGGTYTVNVYDNKGCMGSSTTLITIVPYVSLDKITIDKVAITCNDLETITLTTFDATGATVLGIEYTLSDANGNPLVSNDTTGIFSLLNVGSYIITALNPATGCSIQTVHYVNNPNTFVLKAVKTSDVVCFGSDEGTVELTIVDNQTNPDDEAGAFSYVLTRPDGTTVNGNSPDKGPFTLTGLTAGLYSVTATLVNSPFCSASTSFTIVQPAAALDIIETHTEITCIAGNNDGSISVTATGGWAGGYEFEVLKDGNPFSPYSTQTEYIALEAGVYTINVRDSKGCVDFVNVTLVNPTPIAFTASPSATRVSCFGDTSAIITVDLPTGGSGDYLYTLITTLANGTITTNGPQSLNIFSNLGAGSYQVKVSDSWNCSTILATPIVISQPTKVVASLVTATTITCDNDATLTLSATGGTGLYTYSDNATFTTILGSFATSVTFPVSVGTYHFYVKDANGCVSFVSNDIKIDALEPLEANLDIQNAVINCKGDASGVIVANATGGLGSYVYTLLDGAGGAITPTPVQSAPGRFDGLLAGFYQVKVESGDCDVISIVVEVKEPTTALTFTPNVTDVTCNGAKNGKIEIIASGGTGQIKYAISPRMDQFFDSGIFDKLVPGDYQVVIQDENGCFAVYDFEIKEPIALTVSTVIDSVFPEICAGDKDGAFSIEIIGGTAPYSVSLDNPDGTYTTGTLTQTEFDFMGLSGGNHFVFIRDAMGCTTDWFVALPEAINMKPVAVIEYNCVDNAAANTVTITIDDSITDPTDVDYSLDGGNFQGSSVFTNLTPGSHFVTARHSNGCEQQTMNFEIVQVEPLELILNDGGLNEIVAVAAGGGGDYKYTLNGESYGSKSNFIIYKSGEYTVTVTDANGCVATATRYFEYIDVCIPNNFTPNGDGINDVWAPGCTVNYKDLTFEVFDRYGRKVGNYRLGQYWDGRYKGAELPSGDYWYVLKLNDVKDAREFVGHFTLYR
ncbi:T9SS type B sorting domain-containing protein [Flavobacterium sp. W1B]|uniref:T9SS type B sorting domain-containing protein n=1 Tax=Flavobacterium sp. W1B TaxID=3394146 RepID=UPI0039BC5E1B